MPDNMQNLRTEPEDLECASGASADVRALLATSFHRPARCLDCGELYDRWRLTNGVCSTCAETDDAPVTLLPCGCYSDACFCAQYPTDPETPPAAAMLPTIAPDWTFANLDRADRLRTRFDLPIEGGRNHV